MSARLDHALQIRLGPHHAAYLRHLQAQRLEQGLSGHPVGFSALVRDLIDSVMIGEAAEHELPADLVRELAASSEDMAEYLGERGILQDYGWKRS